ncbi:hypothetical protein [Nocardia exalbida]|uniref:hypothetical protein n=1 Tax=Nocardia exalbida TaxID=290231 RepID=UPI0012F6CD8F|nr:hypothetical protein [Nocardia exalbida]
MPGVELGIDIIMQNRIHERIELVYGDAEDTLARYRENAPAGSLLRGLHAHADTMFNTTQLTMLLDELANLSSNNDKEAEMLAVLRDAAETAIRRNGYLWFSGD